MALDPFDKVKVSYIQSYLGQTVINVQHYNVLTLANAGVTLSDVIESVAAQWAAAFRVFQSTDLRYRLCRMEILGKPDIAEYAYGDGLGLPGQDASPSMPSFTAYSVRQIRASKLTRHGYKRFAGVTEGQVTSGVVSAAQQTNIAAAATDMFTTNNQWFDFDSNQLANVNPIIWGGFDPLYPDGRHSDIIGVYVNPYVTTQNTRKVNPNEGG